MSASNWVWAKLRTTLMADVLRHAGLEHAHTSAVVRAGLLLMLTQPPGVVRNAISQANMRPDQRVPYVLTEEAERVLGDHRPEVTS